MPENKYKIEHKILTLAECAVMDNKEKPASFDVDDISFSHWDFSYHDGWMTDSWIAECTIQADNYRMAFDIFRKKLMRIIPRISLISQTYIEFLNEPFLINKIGSDIAFFRYTTDSQAVGLMFMEGEKEALNLLLENKSIPEEFYYYWNDAVNTIGYSSKLLMMFSALEALAKNRDKDLFKKPFDLYEKILGEGLSHEIFENTVGLRNRLIHGEYFNKDDSSKDYLDQVHKKVISYFNDSILNKKLLHDDVVNPQRHPFGNKIESRDFVKLIEKTLSFSLKSVLDNFSEKGFKDTSKHEHYYIPDFANTY